MFSSACGDGVCFPCCRIACHRRSAAKIVSRSALVSSIIIWSNLFLAYDLYQAARQCHAIVTCHFAEIDLNPKSDCERDKQERKNTVPYVTVGKENGANIDIYYKDWGNGQPIVFSHGWPLSADDWDNQMMFFLNHGYRVIAT